MKLNCSQCDRMTIHNPTMTVQFKDGGSRLLEHSECYRCGTKTETLQQARDNARAQFIKLEEWERASFED